MVTCPRAERRARHDFRGQVTRGGTVWTSVDVAIQLDSGFTR